MIKLLVYRTTCLANGELTNLKLGYMTPQQRRGDDEHTLDMPISKVNSFGNYQFEQTKYFYFFAEDACSIYSSYEKEQNNRLLCKLYKTFEYDLPVELLTPYIGMGTYPNLDHPVLEFAIPYDILREYCEPGFKRYTREELDLRNRYMLSYGVNNGLLDYNIYSYLDSIFKITCLTGNVFMPIYEVQTSFRKIGYDDYILGGYNKFLEVLNIKYNRNGKTYFPEFLKNPVFSVPDDNVYNMDEVEKLLNAMVEGYALTKTIR